MGTVLGIKREVYQEVQAKFKSGFQLPPAGAHILWVLRDFRQSSYTDKKTGEDIEYVSFICEMSDDDGQEFKHWQMFPTMTRDDIQELKAFLVGIGREDWDIEEGELEELVGTKFRCDFVHYNSKNKSTGEVEVKGRFDWKTLVPAGKKAAAKAETSDEDESDVDDAIKPKRGRPRKVEAAPETDDDEGDDGEEEGFKAFSPRRRNRRVAASDKD